MNVLFKSFICVVSALVFAAPTVFAQDVERSKDGTLGCAGNHDFRLGGSEITFTSYTFRNFNTDNTIVIDSITIFAADGTILKQMPSVTDPFPAGFSNVLGPNQTSNFSTRDVFGDSPSTRPSPTPLQTIVKWSASARGLDLVGSVTRQDRRRDTITGNPQEQRARGLSRCISMK